MHWKNKSSCRKFTVITIDIYLLTTYYYCWPLNKICFIRMHIFSDCLKKRKTNCLPIVFTKSIRFIVDSTYLVNSTQSSRIKGHPLELQSKLNKAVGPVSWGAYSNMIWWHDMPCTTKLYCRNKRIERWRPKWRLHWTARASLKRHCGCSGGVRIFSEIMISFSWLLVSGL